MNKIQSNCDNKQCTKHNHPILLNYSLEQDGEYCVACVQEKVRMNSHNFENYQQQKISEQYQVLEQYKQYLESLQNTMQIYKKNVIISLDGITLIIMNELSRLYELKKIQENFQQQTNSNETKQFNELCSSFKTQLVLNDQGRSQIKQHLIKFQEKICNFQQILASLESSEYWKGQIISQQSGSSNIYSNQNLKTDNHNNFKSDKITQFYESFTPLSDGQQSSMMVIENQKIPRITQEETKIQDQISVTAFAINSESNIVAIALCNVITIFQFENGKVVKEHQKTPTYQGQMICLKFMKHSKNFVSGSSENNIIIWNYDNINNRWLAQNMLEEHGSAINCLEIIKNDEMLISGSDDKQVKFWSKNDDKWICQQTIHVNDKVQQMCINEKEDKLFTNGASIYVYVLFCRENKWTMNQTIKISEPGIRFCFTIEDQVIIKPNNQNCLIILDYESDKKSFELVSKALIHRDLDCCYTFPCQFVKSLNILIVKQGKFLNIFKVDQKRNYKLHQIVKFDHNSLLFGAISQDGKYIATWEQEQKSVQFNTFNIDI